MDLYEARKAVQIARWPSAQQYAPETYHKALQGLPNEEGYLTGNAGRKPIVTVVREAVQMAEEARIITVKRIQDEQLANERQPGAGREMRAENERAAAQSETERVARETEKARVAAEADAERLRQDNDTRAAAVRNEAHGLRGENDAKSAAAQADVEKTALRAWLSAQFNAILQGRDTARGLIVNMSDVLFDTAKFSLRPPAREKWSKASGIVSGYPGLRLDVEGHTDSVGGDAYNQRLSEQRGESVRDYLIQQGMPMRSVTTRGFGKTQPVASNDTSESRQENRRVELVISGDIIGAAIGSPIALN